jgi:hypothetical protein
MGADDYINRLLENHSVARWITMAKANTRQIIHYNVA